MPGPSLWNSLAQDLLGLCAARTLEFLSDSGQHCVDLSPINNQNIGLDRDLSDSGQHCVDLSPIQNYNFGWGPNFIESPSSFRCFTTCNGRLHVVGMELLRKMPHQNIGLDTDLSDSGQHCVDLSPVQNYNFGWGPNFIESPSSFRCFTTCNGRLHVVGMELLRKMPHQNIGLDRDLSDSGQHCVDLSPVQNYNFGWGPNFYRVTIFFQMFYDLQRKIPCCWDGTLAQDASPEHWAR